MKVTVVIPARYGSTRFPGKPLADISGKPMVQHVYERASKATLVDEVFVATDDRRIEEAVESFHGKVVLTSKACRSGTDRMAEAARNLSSDIFINVQGDEPLISPRLIDQIASSLISDTKVRIASAAISFKSREDFLDPNIVKVLTDCELQAIYFSRYPIPFLKHAWQKSDSPNRWDDYYSEYSFERIERSAVKKHLGIYGFRREELLKFSQWEPTPLECQEELEQLRILEHGGKIKIVPTEEESVAVDRPEDLNKIIIPF
ncbi:MAG: 3-deoxy-manno-octulosonate cytidylyltransferase [Deltaproteobacteria bacterium]